MSDLRLIVRRFCVSLGVLTLAYMATPSAHAIPPGGAGADTPGTSSTVSPKIVEQCGTLSYEVHGYPAGEIVHIKIDNGIGFAGDSSVQGQGVIATSRIDASGTATGSLEIPCSLPPGEHFLRYLATEGTRNLGYTNSGDSTFTVVAKPQSAGAAESTPQASTEVIVDTQGRGAISRVTNNRGQQPAQAAPVVTEEVVYVDEPATSQGAQSANAAVAAAKPSTTLQAQAAKASVAAPTTSSAPIVQAASGNTGIFDKKEHKPQVIAASNNAPYIGAFVGVAILLVGMTAINVWLFVARSRK
ncbi:hypothetical protein [Corynebacterium sp. HS2168-gen11]|uniref:hypothetical protein n=1 Tax=Corynebacterium sp. HS2168-gen11 TaxID=2974027 RepID=UPI00216B1652|nr:hypothetical protein [Corynebacterium sp. HS2168-gen11]MCS4535689.1 hypothetical protein [Corynebacterium sp. HS2168-gen11]